MPNLVLLRHGESVWNKENIFSGWVDVPLSAKGINEAFAAGDEIAHIPFDVIYTSKLLRASLTFALALSRSEKVCCPIVMHPENNKYAIPECSSNENVVPVITSEELNERFYGDLQGRSKPEVRAEVGEVQFMNWRRSFATRPPNGESLEDTINRAIPFFENEIMPRIVRGENILISAHGNTLRAIVKDLENISDDDVVGLEIPTGKPIIFEYEEGFWKRSKK